MSNTCLKEIGKTKRKEKSLEEIIMNIIKHFIISFGVYSLCYTFLNTNIDLPFNKLFIYKITFPFSAG